ncbi:MAG: hypothetical protein F6K41_21850, partial [Symploca sp. SIO3E6]|nr:hypothetical protein [Caldora sp. SIO3E6]
MNILLEVSDNFINKNEVKQIVYNPISVISQVIFWTNKEPEMTEIILSLIIKNDFQILNGEEEDKVKYFVQNNIIKNWQNSESAPAQHLKTIHDQIIKHQHKTKILLKLYQVLFSEKILTDDSLEVQALLQSKLLVTEDGQLKVHNPIYKAVFNQEWVEKELKYINNPKPYSENTKNKKYIENFLKVLYSIPAKFYPFPIIIFLLLFLGVSFPKLKEWIVSTTQIVPDEIQPGDESIQKPISAGERILITTEEVGQENLQFREAKKSGVEAMASGNYQLAVNYFEEALQHYRNAPETLIYLNNARSEAKNQPTYTIAAAVPITQDLAAAQAMLRGVAQAQHQLNEAGGINGVLLKVVISDDGDNP